ncbi:hypothetical protein [Bradyrhizobium liaoningense]
MRLEPTLSAQLGKIEASADLIHTSEEADAKQSYQSVYSKGPDVGFLVRVAKCGQVRGDGTWLR